MEGTMSLQVAEAGMSRAQRPMEMLSLPFSDIPNSAMPLTQPTSHPSANLLVKMSKMSFPSLRTIGHISDAMTCITLIMMLTRTYLYITRRRTGGVGPAPAPQLLKFFALYGAIQFVTHVLTVYLTPFKSTWLPSLMRATALLAISYGRQLPLSRALYDRQLAPFYESHQADIEAYFHMAREKWEQVNDALQQLATHLLKRIAVGGLPALLNFPTTTPYRTAGTNTTANTTTQSQQEANTSDSHADQPRLPAEMKVFPTARPFFGGEPDLRAKAVAQISTDNLHGAIQSARVDAPKAAFEDARAMRLQFRRRAESLSRSSSGAPS